MRQTAMSSNLKVGYRAENVSVKHTVQRTICLFKSFRRHPRFTGEVPGDIIAGRDSTSEQFICRYQDYNSDE